MVSLNQKADKVYCFTPKLATLTAASLQALMEAATEELRALIRKRLRRPRPKVSNQCDRFLQLHHACLSRHWMDEELKHFGQRNKLQS